MNYRLLYIIAPWQMKNNLLEALEEQGCKKLSIMHGKGMNSKKRWSGAEEKVVIVAMCKSEYIEGVYRRLNTKFGFEKSNTGLAFSLDVGFVANKEGK